MDRLTAANSAFALNLFKKLSQNNNTANVFFSPLSISSALTMVSLGAAGNTAAQMAKVYPDKYVLLPTDSYPLWFLQDFLAGTQKFYRAELATVDFQYNSDNTRKQINQWVKDQTEGKICDLLPEHSIDKRTKLVLVNAIYFRADWAEKFQDKFTMEMPFRLNMKEKKMVNMMFLKKKLPLGHIPECRCRVLELPYEGKEFSMMILLPDDIEDSSTGLEQLEKHLTFGKLLEWTHPAKMENTVVYVHLPKFKLEESYNLNNDLAALGLLDIFNSRKADLSGMSEARNLYVSHIVHKSFIEVNEEGAEAAAATAVVITTTCTSTHIMEVDFNADHPFLFFVRHNPTRSVLFFGRFASP
uniref:leukocyte elastase inhibitor n=1 Tax=Podarcis muralis TaxID=64176 RepID=UPI00109FBC15|nr:leukocyte elastase inhibitor [Podarcis muralis]